MKNVDSPIFDIYCGAKTTSCAMCWPFGRLRIFNDRLDLSMSGSLELLPYIGACFNLDYVLFDDLIDIRLKEGVGLPVPGIGRGIEFIYLIDGVSRSFTVYAWSQSLLLSNVKRVLDSYHGISENTRKIVVPILDNGEREML